jgi:hypothetical protein
MDEPIQTKEPKPLHVEPEEFEPSLRLRW